MSQILGHTTPHTRKNTHTYDVQTYNTQPNQSNPPAAATNQTDNNTHTHTKKHCADCGLCVVFSVSFVRPTCGIPRRRSQGYAFPIIRKPTIPSFPYHSTAQTTLRHPHFHTSCNTQCKRQQQLRTENEQRDPPEEPLCQNEQRERQTVGVQVRRFVGVYDFVRAGSTMKFSFVSVAATVGVAAAASS